jgi:hypothetical protein
MEEIFLSFGNLTTKYFIGRFCRRMARPEIYISSLPLTRLENPVMNSKREFGFCHEAAIEWAFI